MTRVAVTGASGFLARHLIPMLLAEGHEVRGLARHMPQPAHAATISGFTFVSGDVRNRDAVRELLRDAEWVIHLAAGRDPADPMADIIVRGTETVLDAASGATRVVVVSCLGAQASSPSAYYEAKWRAEMLTRSSGLPFVILQPSLLMGNGDGIVRPLAHVIRRLPAVPIPGSGQHRLQPIDVNDMARCLLLAPRRDDLLGETIPVGGPMYLTFRQLVDLVGECMGRGRPKLLVPPPLLAAVAPVLPREARCLYTGPRLAAFLHGMVASPGVVARHFGFGPSNVVPRLGEYAL